MSTAWADSPVEEEEEGDPPFAPRRSLQDTELDMTPMIDCTFLLLIFFTVGSKMESAAAVQLPSAHYGVGVSPEKTVIFTVALGSGGGSAEVYLGDGKIGAPLPADPGDLAKAIREALEQVVPAKDAVLIKAERTVLHKDVTRVAAAAAEVDGIRALYVAVLEAGGD